MAEADVAIRRGARARAETGAPPPLVAFGVALAGVLGALSVLRGVFDPDYFWHLATGRLIVERGAIPTTDPFSFTWQGEPWIPDQWLSDLLIYGIVGGVGPILGLLIFGGVAAGAVVLVAAAMRRAGAGYAAILGVSLLVAATIFPQVTMRPQVLSLPLLAAVIFVLVTATPASAGRLLVLPPLFLLWANLHGFYVVGLGVGFAYLVASWLGRTPMAPRRGRMLAVGLVSLVAAAVTPSGPAGILYSLSFADPNDWGARNIAEWQSPNFHDPQFLPFLLLIVALLAFGSRGPGWLRFVAFVGLALGLLAIRSVAVAALMAMPTLVLGVDEALRARRDRPSGPLSGRGARGWIDLAAAVAVAAVVAVFAVSRASAVPQPSPQAYPVASVEWLAENRPDARVLASYGWGGYVLNELYALGGRVFVDGRMHKYAADVVDDYASIVAAEPGWERLVDEYGVDVLLLRTDFALARGPATASGWCEVIRDDPQVLLLRSCP